MMRSGKISDAAFRESHITPLDLSGLGCLLDTVSNLQTRQQAAFADCANLTDDWLSWTVHSSNGMSLTAGATLKESHSTAAYSRRKEKFFDNQANQAGASTIDATKRRKSFSPRSNFRSSDKSSVECEWFSYKSAARYLDTTEGALRNRVWRGHITPQRVNGGRSLRFKKSELDRLLESSLLKTKGGFYGS